MNLKKYIGYTKQKPKNVIKEKKRHFIKNNPEKICISLTPLRHALNA